MRISDWSSDVCSSDLACGQARCWHSPWPQGWPLVRPMCNPALSLETGSDRNAWPHPQQLTKRPSTLYMAPCLKGGPDGTAFLLCLQRPYEEGPAMSYTTHMPEYPRRDVRPGKN